MKLLETSSKGQGDSVSLDSAKTQPEGGHHGEFMDPALT